MEQDQVNGEVVPLGQELSDNQDTQAGYFSDMHKSVRIIFQTL